VLECVQILIVNAYEPWRPDNLTQQSERGWEERLEKKAEPQGERWP